MSEHAYAQWQPSEVRRLEQQAILDSQRSAFERNVCGQFATPPALAEQIVRYALSLHFDRDIHFLEPSVGSGAFFSSLLKHMRDKRLATAVGVETDHRFATLAGELWGTYGLTVKHGDFTGLHAPALASTSLLIANPPYVRHHHISSDQKKSMAARVYQELELRPSGLAGLYVYFMLLAHQGLRRGAISAWLVPTEFMDVNYGQVVKQYLTTKVTLRRIHQFEACDVQFNDALVTSAVVFFENCPPKLDTVTEFTSGGNVQDPRRRTIVEHRALQPATKWSRYFLGRANETPRTGPVMGDYLKIRRGIATGANGFFVLPKDEIDRRRFHAANVKPILPSPRHVRDSVIHADEDGWPLVERQLALIDTQTPLKVLGQRDPALAAYLSSAPEKVRSSYLVKQRDIWYRQEQRPPAPFLCTYMGRGVDDTQPFRFILNLSDAVATNMFLMLYPTRLLVPFLTDNNDGLYRVHAALQAISAADLRAGGRVYGGGLHKLEPKEFASMPADALLTLAPNLPRLTDQMPPALFDHRT